MRDGYERGHILGRGITSGAGFGLGGCCSELHLNCTEHKRRLWLFEARGWRWVAFCITKCTETFPKRVSRIVLISFRESSIKLMFFALFVLM